MTGIFTRLLGYVSFVFVPALCLLLAGCTSRPLPSHEYFALIENIDDVPGQHYSPSKGQEPLYAFDLRITNPKDHQTHLRLLVFGLKDTERLGTKGDKISFRIVGPFPVTGDLWLEQLAEYRVFR